MKLKTKFLPLLGLIVFIVLLWGYVFYKHITQIEYQVISDVFNSILDNIPNTGAKAFAICDSTAIPPYPIQIDSLMSKEINLEDAKYLLKDFTDKNQKKYALRSNFHFNIPYILIPEYYDPIQYKEYGGIKGFSRLGFTKNRKIALLYYDATGGPLSGIGYYFLIIKRDGKWVLLKQIRSWVS